MTAIFTGFSRLIVRPHGAMETAAIVQPAVDIFQKVRRGDRRVRRIDLDLDLAERGLHDRRGPARDGDGPARPPRDSQHRRRRAFAIAIIGKIFPGFRIPSGSNACLTRFISAISSADSSSGRNGALAKPIPCSPLIDPSSATTPANSARSASCARAISSASSLSTMMLTWMLPSPAWPKHGIRRSKRSPDLADEREQLGDPSLRHHHVVVELQRRNHLQRQRQLAAHAPQLLPLGFVAGAQHFGCAGCAARRFDAAGFFVDRFGDAVHFEQQERRRAFRRERPHARDCGRPPRASRRRSARAPPARRARG